MKVVVAGGAGSLGRRLCAFWTAAGHEVVVLSRSPQAGPYRTVPWDGRTAGEWASELEGAAVVNLAGALVDRRPTAANVRLLTRSRVEPTRALVEAAAALPEPVPVWIQASTLAIYGDAGDVRLDEESPVADGPPQMAGVARAWEEAARGAHAVRQVVLRTGIVLDRDSPALDRLLGLARWGLGGRIASGDQWISWLHIYDWLAIADVALHDDRLRGVVHATGPQPVRNRELMAALRRAVHRPAAPPTPGFAVRLGAWAMRTDPALALTGRRAVPARLADLGLEFRHPEIGEALRDLVTLGQSPLTQR